MYSSYIAYKQSPASHSTKSVNYMDFTGMVAQSRTTVTYSNINSHIVPAVFGLCVVSESDEDICAKIPRISLTFPDF